MPFEIKKISEHSTSFEVGENLWLKADGLTVVHEGDPQAAFLLASAGKRLSHEEAEGYGLISKSAAKAESKEAEPESDKEAKPKRRPSRSR